MGVEEQRAPGRERIDVRRLDLGMSAEAANPVVLIIDRDEENIGRSGGVDGHAESEKCNEHKKRQSSPSSCSREQLRQGQSDGAALMHRDVDLSAMLAEPAGFAQVLQNVRCTVGHISE
jgi:hypothetical protein